MKNLFKLILLVGFVMPLSIHAEESACDKLYSKFTKESKALVEENSIFNVETKKSLDELNKVLADGNSAAKSEVFEALENFGIELTKMKETLPKSLITRYAEAYPNPVERDTEENELRVQKLREPFLKMTILAGRFSNRNSGLKCGVDN